MFSNNFIWNLFIYLCIGLVNNFSKKSILTSFSLTFNFSTKILILYHTCTINNYFVFEGVTSFHKATHILSSSWLWFIGVFYCVLCHWVILPGVPLSHVSPSSVAVHMEQLLVSTFIVSTHLLQKRPMGTSWLDSDLRPASRMCKLTTRSSSWSTATPARSSDPLVLLTAASVTTVWVSVWNINILCYSDEWYLKECGLLRRGVLFF